jgi:predicted nucleic acid-binding protein
MTRYLLDTNHMSDAIRRASRVRDTIRQHRRQGDRFATCLPVLCELEIGIRQTGSIEANHRRLKGVLETVKVWPLEMTVPPVYAEYYERAKARGRALDPVDLFLAALASLQKAVVLTADLDFSAFPEITTENWRG